MGEQEPKTLILRNEHGELVPFDDIAVEWAKEAVIDALEDDVSWVCDGSPASIAHATRPEFACGSWWGLVVESVIEALVESGAIKRLPYEDEDFYVLADRYDETVAAIEEDEKRIHGKDYEGE